eukprot:5127228-Amphidinium_carterae.1
MNSLPWPSGGISADAAQMCKRLDWGRKLGEEKKHGRELSKCRTKLEHRIQDIFHLARSNYSCDNIDYNCNSKNVFL